MDKILKRLCYRQIQDGLYIKTIANSYLCLKVVENTVSLAQVFMGADEQLYIWSRKDGAVNELADLVSLEMCVIRPNGFNTVIFDFDSFFPPLSQQEIIELLLY